MEILLVNAPFSFSLSMNDWVLKRLAKFGILWLLKRAYFLCIGVPSRRRPRPVLTAEDGSSDQLPLLIRKSSPI